MDKKNYIRLNNEVNFPVDGRIPLNKDVEAARAYYKEHVYTSSRMYADFEERLNFLVDEDYIDRDVVEQYPFEFIQELSNSILAKKIRFKSFMAPYKLHSQYLMKDTKEDGSPLYLERYEDRILFNALYGAHGDQELARQLAEEMAERRYQPATPTFANAGKKHRGEFVSCFLLTVPDDMNGIGRAINSALQLSRIGGGVGINLSNLREGGAPIKIYKNAASGVLPVMKLFENAFNYSNQLGQRAGAGVVYLHAFHMDILDFLSTKNENAEDSKRIKTLSVGVVVPDIYYELVEKNEVMHLFSTYDVQKEYGIPFAEVDFTAEYQNLVNNPNIKKKTIKSSVLSDLIGTVQQESGYPYILNVDNANRTNPIDGKISMSNLCSEILQVQTLSKVNDKQEYEELGKDISCNLGSINIPNFMKSPDPEKSIETMVRALSHISDDSNIVTVPSVAKGNRESHAIGLGAMGLHQMFASNQMMYGDPDTVEFTDKFFEMINFLTLKASMKIAKERKETFVGFERSKYADGTYFDMYLDESLPEVHEYKFPKNREILNGFPVPNKEDWRQLKEDVMKYGIYNQNRMAVAPNGSISYINETTASLHPIVNLIERRQEKKIGTVFYPTPGLNDETLPYYKSAYDISMLKVIDVYAAAQKHIDQGMSLTIFMRGKDIPAGLYPWKPEGGSLSTRDLTLIRHYAWKKGIKTLYYVRTYTDDDDQSQGIKECESCMV